MKELHTFRQFMEGKGSTVKLNKSDMDKLHKDGKIEKDDHTIEFGEGKDTPWGGNKGGQFDKKNMPWGGKDPKNPNKDIPWGGKSTFEITPEYLFDAAIKYIQDDYDGASLHVAPDGTTDDFYDGDKHTFTIKSKEQAEDIIDNFEAQAVKTAQNDWADEQDAMYGKASFVEEEDLSENDKALDEVLKEDPISITAIGRELASMDKEEALKTIDRLIDYLKTVEHRIITRR